MKTRIIEMYESGNSCRQIEKETGISRHKISQILKEEGVFVSNRKYQKYNESDIAFLKEKYEKNDWAALLTKFKNKQTVHGLASKYHIPHGSAWSEDDLKIVKNNMYNKSFSEIASMLSSQRTVEAVRTKAVRLGYRNDRSWSEEEFEILNKYYSILPIDEFCKLLPNRSKDVIIMYASDRGIKSYDTIRELWKDYEDQYIIDNYIQYPDDVLAKKLNRKLRAVKWRRVVLGCYRNTNVNNHQRLNQYIRHKMYQWIKDVEHKDNYRCVITGSPKYAVHHIISLNSLILNALHHLNISEQLLFDDYSEEQLNAVFLYVKQQCSVENGVCVRPDLHKLFHRLYGYTNTTFNDWNMFIFNYKSGYYNYILNNKKSGDIA